VRSTAQHSIAYELLFNCFCRFAASTCASDRVVVLTETSLPPIVQAAQLLPRPPGCPGITRGACTTASAALGVTMLLASASMVFRDFWGVLVKVASNHLVLSCNTQAWHNMRCSACIKKGPSNSYLETS
jgi:hypothetical protein